jgi:hypothetical protein
MDLNNILIIMFFTGIFGGIVNYYSDANKVSETKEIKRPILQCLIFGIAATLIVPLFFKIADSKLVENIKIKTEQNDNSGDKIIFDSYNIYNKIDSTGKVIKIDTIKNIKQNTSLKTDAEQLSKSDSETSAKDYLLWTAYCLLAAAAGMRFIDLLMNKFLTQEQLSKAEEGKKAAENKAEKLKANAIKNNEKVINNFEANQELEIETMLENSEVDAEHRRESIHDMLLSKLPPIINAEDPQKGRFGGKFHVNGRILYVNYSKSNRSEFLNLTIKVATDNKENKLQGNVYLFLHNSFPKSIIKLEAESKTEVSYNILAYGAFTIGAVTDEGKTMLELDIAEQRDFPEDFRKR